MQVRHSLTFFWLGRATNRRGRLGKGNWGGGKCSLFPKSRLPARVLGSCSESALSLSLSLHTTVGLIVCLEETLAHLELKAGGVRFFYI